MIIVPLFILVQKMGMVNTYAGLIIPVTFNAFGIFLLRQFFMAIPRDLDTYLEFRRLSIEFTEARNRRIDQLALDVD